VKFFINEKFLLFSWHLSPRDTRSEFQNTAVLSQLASKAIILYLFLQVNYIWVPKYPKSFWVFWCSFQWLNQGKTNPCNTCCSTESLKVAQKSFQQLDFDGSLQPPFFTWCYNHGIKKTGQSLVNMLSSFSWHNMLPVHRAQSHLKFSKL